MGIEVIPFTDVTAGLQGFYGAPIIAGGIVAFMVLGLGGFGLYTVINAFRR